MIYQIIGWPRSRTAWLANFLTYDKSMCTHEGMYCRKDKQVMGVRSYHSYLDIRDGLREFTGDANTLALYFQEYIHPKARVVIIDRDRKDVMNSVKKLGRSVIIPCKYKMPKNETLVVKFNDIDKELEAIWAFCLPGIPYHEGRAAILKEFRIEVKDINQYI